MKKRSALIEKLKSEIIEELHSRRLEQYWSVVKAVGSLPPGAEREELLKRLVNHEGLVWSALVEAKLASIRSGKKRARDLFANLASQDLKGLSHIVALRAKIGDKKFFIALGKYLSGELKAGLWDRTDVAIVSIVLANPGITAKDALHELQKRGLTLSGKDKDIESAFRMRKKRLGLAEFLRYLAP
jgi:hypothetical protein